MMAIDGVAMQEKMLNFQTLYIFTSLTIIQKLYACTLLHTELWIISIKQDEAVPVVQIKLMRNKYRVGWLVPCAK